MTSYFSTVSRVVLNTLPKVNLPSLANLFNNTVFCWQDQSPVQLPERSKIILETNPITKTTKKYPRTKPKAGRQADVLFRLYDGTSPQTVAPDMFRLPTFKPLVVSTPEREAPSTIHGLQRCRRWHRWYSRTSTDNITPTDERWPDDKNWVLIYSSATDQRHGGVGLVIARHIHKCL